MAVAGAMRWFSSSWGSSLTRTPALSPPAVIQSLGSLLAQTPARFVMAALHSLGSLLAQTPSLGWGFAPPHPETRTLRSMMPLRVRVLGVEDDLRTPALRWAVEITSSPPLVEGL
jgi:hypothetical protein